MFFPIGKFFNFIWGITVLAAIVACIYCLYSAFSALPYSNDEDDAARICHYPSEVLYKYFVIGRTNEAGSLVADFWLNTNYLKLDTPEHELERHRSGPYYSWYRKVITQAIGKNFNLSLADITPPDKDIVLTISGLKENCESSKRRAVFSERFNDFLHFFGLATLFGLLSWGLLSIPERLLNR